MYMYDYVVGSDDAERVAYGDRGYYRYLQTIL
jgi:hypothetical protein